MSRSWRVAQRVWEAATCHRPLNSPRIASLSRSIHHHSHPSRSWPPLRSVHSHLILRHASVPFVLAPPGFGRRAFQEPFRRSSSTGSENTLPKVKDATLGEKVLYTLLAFSIMWVYHVYLPSWDEALDYICRFVPPKTIPPTTTTHPNPTIHNPTDQDPPTRDLIVLPDEFRILVLEPSPTPTSTIHCRLLNVVPSWRTRYEALSYTWGDDTPNPNNPNNVITLDGLRTPVTSNLHSALTHLRHRTRPRMLWVDALCIDQEHIAERDAQVARMGKIYAAARRVVIWLGEETAEVKGAVELLRRTKYYNSWSSRRRDDGSGGWALEEDWGPVLELLRRPWFQRTWVVQEAVLAREPVVACGFETVPLELLAKRCGLEAFQDVVPEGDPVVRWALDAMDMIGHGRHEHHTKTRRERVPGRYRRGRRRYREVKYEPDFRLVSTLYETRGFQCRDKRDKVFGILSLVLNVEDDDEVRKLGYGHSLEEIYEVVAQWDITKNESLEVLSYCSRKGVLHHPDLPSWVPDFSDMDDASPVAVTRELTHPKGSNPGFLEHNRPFFYKQNGRMVLNVRGEVIDSIATVGPVAEHSRMVVYTHPQKGKGENDAAAGTNDIGRPDLSAVARRREWFRECIHIALASDPIAARPTLPEHAAAVDPVSLLESPTLGMSVYQYDRFREALASSQLSSDTHNYVKFLYKDVGVEPDWEKDWERRYESIDRNLRKYSYGRRFCATRTGKMGWVPGAAREGDLVCLVSGAQVPIILRRVLSSAGEADRYMVVGDAHLGDQMYPGKGKFYLGGQSLAIV